ncbi:MAG: hypothetical protein K9M08_07870 [Pirellula sp.]|nr:hypothetical protein [Pirellula sp.]
MSKSLSLAIANSLWMTRARTALNDNQSKTEKHLSTVTRTNENSLVRIDSSGETDN